MCENVASSYQGSKNYSLHRFTQATHVRSPYGKETFTLKKFLTLIVEKTGLMVESLSASSIRQTANVRFKLRINFAKIENEQIHVKPAQNNSHA